MFPVEMVCGYGAELLQHRLRKEIIATALANNIVDHMGITFVVHLMEFVGGTGADVARAYMASSESFGVREWYQQIAAVEGVDEEIKLSMLLEIIRLGRRATRWILRQRQELLGVEEFVERYQPRIAELIECRKLLLSDRNSAAWASNVTVLVALPIIDVAESTHTRPRRVAEVFSSVANELGLDWLMDQVAQLSSSSHWQSMERDSLVDDITSHQGMIAERCLTQSAGDVQPWLATQERFALAWRRVIDDAQQAAVKDFSMFSMTCRKLGDLCRSI